MPQVYRLEPVAEHIRSEHWQGSTVPPITCWVLAESEDEARQLLTQATIIARKVVSRAADSPVQPWMSPELVRCTVDEFKHGLAPRRGANRKRSDNQDPVLRRHPFAAISPPCPRALRPASRIDWRGRAT